MTSAFDENSDGSFNYPDKPSPCNPLRPIRVFVGSTCGGKAALILCEKSLLASWGQSNIPSVYMEAKRSNDWDGGESILFRAKR